MNVPIEEYNRDPEGFFQRVLEGETIFVTEFAGRPVVEIRRVESATPSGLAPAASVVPDDESSPDDVLRDVEG
jgi:antitoxin (DNA-binding transcriptional repressor) of toxin-antitoxin stability system